MNIPSELWIGFRYIKNRKNVGGGNKFISFISMLSIVGITLGVGALIIVLSVMNGFQKEITDKILSATSHIEITSPSGALTDYEEVMRRISVNKRVIASSPYVNGQVMISSQKPKKVGTGVQGVIIRGIDPQTENNVSDFSKKTIEGSFLDLNEEGKFKIAIGEGLAQRMSAKVGDKLTIIAPEGVVTPVGIIPRIKAFEVAAVFKVGMFEYDNGLVLTNIKDAKSLLRLGEQVTGVRVKTSDPYFARQIAKEISLNMPEDLFLDDWTLSHANFFRAIQIEKKMMFIILSLIVAVAAFNIVSTLVMAVTDKRKDIAILRTIGMSERGILGIFMIQGVIIGLVGTIIGMIFGVIVSLNIDTIVPFIESVFNVQFIPSDVYMLSELPSELQLKDVIQIGVSSLFVTILSTIYPSIKAAKTQPAEALRNE